MKKKIVILTIAIILLVPVFFVFMTFKNSKGCNQLVIDTYEIHSGIDIPDVNVVNCYYDEKLGTRITVFDLNTTINISAFESINFDTTNDALLRGKYLLGENELPSKPKLLYASGEKFGNKWTYLVDTRSGRLWAELDY